MDAHVRKDDTEAGQHHSFPEVHPTVAGLVRPRRQPTVEVVTHRSLAQARLLNRSHLRTAAARTHHPSWPSGRLGLHVDQLIGVLNLESRPARAPHLRHGSDLSLQAIGRSVSELRRPNCDLAITQ